MIKKKQTAKKVQRKNRKANSKVTVYNPEVVNTTADIREDLFVKELIKNNFNATQALVDSGYTKNKKSAGTIAVRMLDKVSIQTKLKAELARLYRGRDIRIEKLIDQMERIAFCDIKDFLSFKENLVTFKDSDAVDGRMIQSITSVTTEMKGVKKTTMKLQLWDKLKAIEMLGKHLAMFTDTTPAGIKDPSKITNVTVKIHQKIINNNN